MTLQSLDFNNFDNLTNGPSLPKSLLKANRDELDIKLNITNVGEQELPNDLQGHVFIVAPVGTSESQGLPHVDGDSFMCGDGMIYRLDFNQPGEVALKTRILKTPDYYADLATANQDKHAQYTFNNHGMLRFSSALGSRNPLSVAFLPVKFANDELERLLVTYDGGRQYEIDTETLELATPVGSNKEWQPEVNVKFPFPAVLSTAHPAFDARLGEMFTINYGRSLENFMNLPHISVMDKFWGKLTQHFPHAHRKGELLEDFLYLIRWDGEQPLERWKLILPDGSPVKIKQSIHQIGLSKDYIVIIDTFFTTGLEQTINNPLPEWETLEEKIREKANLAPTPETYVYIVPRAALIQGQRPSLAETEVEVTVIQAKLPSELTHFLVDYDNPTDKVTIHAVHASSWYASEWVRNYDHSAYEKGRKIESHLWGMLPSVMDVSRLGRYTINGKTGELVEQKKIPDTFDPNIKSCRLSWGITLYAYQDRLPSAKHPAMPPETIDNVYWTSVGLWGDTLTEFVYNYYEKLNQKQPFHQPLVQPDEVLDLGKTGMPSSLFRIETKSIAIADSYEFPPGFMSSSPQFVPRESSISSTDGYIVCTVHCGDAENQSHQIWIFEADKLHEGAKWKLTHPKLTFGFTLHTTWLSQVAPRQAKYHISVEEDFQELIADQPKLKAFFEQEIYPHFE